MAKYVMMSKHGLFLMKDGSWGTVAGNDVAVFTEKNIPNIPGAAAYWWSAN